MMLISSHRIGTVSAAHAHFRGTYKARDHMNSRLIITLLCGSAVALACGSLARTDTAASAPRRSTESDTVHLVSVNSSFAVNVEPRALRFALDVSNAGKKNVELAFPDGQQFEFSVIDSLGREVLRWGAGRMFTQSVQNRLIDGGDTMRIDERIAASLPRGKYVAIATLRSSNFPMTERSTFELR